MKIIVIGGCGHIGSYLVPKLVRTGNQDYRVFDQIRRGEELILPNFGIETLHHVHADGVAQVFLNATTHRGSALGESFHAVGNESITLLGDAQAMYRCFGQEERISFLPWKGWCQYIKDEELVDKTYYHIARSGYYSIEKEKRRLALSLQTLSVPFVPLHTLRTADKQGMC